MIKLKPKLFVQSLWEALKFLARGRSPLVSNKRRQARLRVCYFCPYFIGKQCAVCSCLVSLKTALRSEKCPKQRWF